MDNSPKKETMMFVALPGTEPYTELPKKQVKEQLDKGVLKQSALIWSQKHNSWKQARHITQLIASKLQPRPAQAPLASQPRPQIQVKGAVAPQIKAVAQPQAKRSAQPAAAKAPAVAKKTASAATTPSADLSLEPPHRTPMWVKALCAGLIVVILMLTALNWYHVDSAIKANLVEDNTPFKEAPLYAHLGGFFQPNILVIHLRPTDKVNRENFLQYLSAIAAATPHRPFSDRNYEVVSLSSGWSGDYQLSGYQWKRLGKPDISDDDRRAILVQNLYVAGGDKLIPKNSLDASGRQALEDKRWNEFVLTFINKH